MNPPDVFTDRSRILIVDDERHNRQLLEVMLAPSGFTLDSASSGEEALAKVAQQPPDLILLDIMMPGMDGYQVAGAIKGQSSTRNIPIIMVTALDDREARLLGLTAGAEDFLTKPVDRAELTARVRNLLRLKAYGDYYDKYAQTLETEVSGRTEALRRERDRAQRYLDTAEVILLALDLERRVTLVNRYACGILGWEVSALVGRDWGETCLPLRIRAGFPERFRRMLAGDGPLVENYVLSRTGEERLIEWRNTVLKDNTGVVIGTFSSGADITERQRAVEELRVTEERMRFALRNADIGIWDMDYRTGTLRWSEILEAQYGLEPGTFKGTFDAFVGCIHPEDRAATLETIEQATKSGDEFSILSRSAPVNGAVRWLAGTGRFNLGHDGAPLRGLGISQDVTEQRLLQAQHQQAQKMEAVGQLASGVAHDFNNLLTVISGFAELVIDATAAGSQQAKDLDEILQATRRATGLTQQLLAFGRQQVLVTEPLDVNALIADMARMLERLIGKNFVVAQTLAAGLPLAVADRGQIEQVVMNLTVNGRDAMPDGGTITIETKLVDLEDSVFHAETVVPGPYIMLAVADTGTGMTAETRRRLFEPFFTTKEIGKGTGLGLSTTYGIVKQNKGYIWVYSELGIGTTFKVYLPCSVHPVVAVAGPVVDAPTGPASQTVLIVEDEAGVRELSNRILSQAGYRVFEAASGEEAESVFARHAADIDLVITDVIMPDCAGPELLSRLHRRAPSLRVLYMSGYTEAFAAKATGLDPSSLVQKPFTGAEFTRHVRAALSRPLHHQQ